jgi:hypothetical protein
MRLPDLTHGFLVSFAEPGTNPRVLIPLDTYGGGFYAIASLVYAGLRSSIGVENNNRW